MELKEKILEGIVCVYNEKGLKFTMDDVAKAVGMSKKTIYTVFRDKEAMLLAMADYIFGSIKEEEQKIIEDDSLSTIEKIRRILVVLPEGYENVDFRQLYQLQDKYPEINRYMAMRLETGWETTIRLLEQGIKEGVIRNVNIPIVKMIVETALEQFVQRDVLIQNQINYIDALQELVNIVVDGIVTRDEY